MKLLLHNFLVRFYLRQSESEQILLLSCGFSLSLVAFRALYTGHVLFFFLVWNLFLAYVPYFISEKMTAWTKGKRIWPLLAALALWLAFIPNTFYMLTDLFHLDMNEQVPLWYDLALLLSFAWSGLIMGIMSVRQVEIIIMLRFGRRAREFFILPVMALNGLGVYIGRYLRFNSWDVLTNPFQLLQEIMYLFIHPLRNRFDWSMIVCYTVLLTLIYLTIRKLGKLL